MKNAYLQNKQHRINVFIIYILLLVDLTINITEKLIPIREIRVPASQAESTTGLRNNGGNNFTNSNEDRMNGNVHHNDYRINTTAFIIVLVQILSIICAIINLIFHFLEAANKIRLEAIVERVTKQTKPNNNGIFALSSTSSPQSQSSEHLSRRASKQNNNNNNNIDPNSRVNKNNNNNNNARFKEQINRDLSVESQATKLRLPTGLPISASIKLVIDRYWWSLVVAISYLILSLCLQIVRIESGLSVTETMDNKRKVEYVTNQEKVEENFQQHEQIWMPILISMLHKLMSTCYYVSFVVIYRLTPDQIKERILAQEPTIMIHYVK